MTIYSLIRINDSPLMRREDSYALWIYWEVDQGIEHFIIHYPTAEELVNWTAQLQRQGVEVRSPSCQRLKGVPR